MYVKPFLQQIFSFLKIFWVIIGTEEENIFKIEKDFDFDSNSIYFLYF